MTSGGDVPGLNACIRAVVKAAMYNKLEITGIQKGYDGLISGSFIVLDNNTVSDIIHTGGTILKSSRSEEFKTKEGRLKAYKNIRTENIDAIILIGGDGSFQGANAFISEYNIPFIGIPKTIDNDISHTDVCIGYDTAINTAMQAIDKIRDSAQSHERIFIVEVMGRDSGYIAFGSGIAGGAEIILMPEIKEDFTNLERILKEGWDKNKSSMIIVVAEGDESGGVTKLADEVRRYMYPHDVRVSVLGHMQRGGSPTASDRILASKLGFEAVEALLRGEVDVMVGMKNNSISINPLNLITRHHLEFNQSIVKMIAALTN